ncbi:DMT family transporter [Alsobacter sp. R-9]
MDRAVLRAYGLAFLAMAMFTVEAVLIRLIGPQANAPQLALVRCLIQFAFLALWLRGSFRIAFTSSRPMMHVMRGMLSAVGSVAYFYAFAHLPLATATVIFFGNVIFTTAAAGPLLGETVGWRRWTATIVGFLGILVVVRPTTMTFDVPMLVALFLALNSAGITLATKGLTRTEPTATIMGYIALMTTVVNLPWAVATWDWPSPTIWVLTVAIGVVGTLGQWASISSFRGADASGIAPVQYLRIVFSAIAGAWLFAEMPDAQTVVGAALVTLSALYITIREATLSRRAPPASAAASEAGEPAGRLTRPP